MISVKKIIIISFVVFIAMWSVDALCEDVTGQKMQPQTGIFVTAVEVAKAEKVEGSVDGARVNVKMEKDEQGNENNEQENQKKQKRMSAWKVELIKKLIEKKQYKNDQSSSTLLLKASGLLQKDEERARGKEAIDEAAHKKKENKN